MYLQRFNLSTIKLLLFLAAAFFCTSCTTSPNDAGNNICHCIEEYRNTPGLFNPKIPKCSELNREYMLEYNKIAADGDSSYLKTYEGIIGTCTLTNGLDAIFDK